MTRIFALLLLLSSSAIAQNKLILYGQGNSANQHIYTPGFEEHGANALNFKSGYGGGIRYDIALNRTIAVSYRLNYSQKGFGQRSNNFHYLGLDHALTILPPLWGNNCIYLLGGLRNERLLHARVNGSYMNNDNDTQISISDFNDWSFGAFFGFGYQRERLFLELGYNFDIQPSLNTSLTKVKNNLWFLNVGFHLI